MKCRSRPVVSACLHPPLRVAGFTLIEVLLATALLAFGLGLAIAALRSTTHSVRLSEEEATRTETVRIVQQFLRRQLAAARPRSEEHTSELQSLMRISYAVFCLKKKTIKTHTQLPK